MHRSRGSAHRARSASADSVPRPHQLIERRVAFEPREHDRLVHPERKLGAFSGTSSDHARRLLGLAELRPVPAAAERVRGLLEHRHQAERLVPIAGGRGRARQVLRDHLPRTLGIIARPDLQERASCDVEPAERIGAPGAVTNLPLARWLRTSRRIWPRVAKLSNQGTALRSTWKVLLFRAAQSSISPIAAVRREVSCCLEQGLRSQTRCTARRRTYGSCSDCAGGSVAGKLGLQPMLRVGIVRASTRQR